MLQESLETRLQKPGALGLQSHSQTSAEVESGNETVESDRLEYKRAHKFEEER